MTALPIPERAALFLDFDGTLVDIADRPDGVSVAPGLPDLIRAASSAAGGALAVVSGRKIMEIDDFLALPVAAAGMHGLERRSAPGADIEFAPPPDAIDELRQRLSAWDGLTGGVTMEDKGAGLAIHYRADPARETEVKTAMAGFTADLPDLHLIHGKMVVEAKGTGFDKGAAVDAFLTHPPFVDRTPIFIGDDTTDEDGMRAAQSAGGFGVKVGDGPSCAFHRVPDVAAVHAYLDAFSKGARP